MELFTGQNGIIKQKIKGVHNCVINKYSSRNITVLEGRAGSGKTYYMENFLGIDSSRKLLLASDGSCKHDYLSLVNTNKIAYCDTLISIVSIIDSLFCLLEKEVINHYDVIIIEDISFCTETDINKLFNLCLHYQETAFFFLTTD